MYLAVKTLPHGKEFGPRMQCYEIILIARQTPITENWMIDAKWHAENSIDHDPSLKPRRVLIRLQSLSMRWSVRMQKLVAYLLRHP